MVIMSEQVEYWKTRWKENKTEWHINEIHPALIQYLNRLTDTPVNTSQCGTNLKIFIPLCGKTIDMLCLLNRGFSVFGVEGVTQPIEEFQMENRIEMKFDEQESIYSTQDGKLKIYVGDIFQCPIEKWGPFDCIWDRGSFIAIDYHFRSPYLDVLRRSVKKADGKYNNFKYLLETVKYDKRQFGGPPRCVDENDMQELFANWAKVEILKNTKLPEDSSLHKVIDAAAVTDLAVDNVVYLMKPK